MDREFIQDKVPDQLIERLTQDNAACAFRRRAVLTKSVDHWELVCCTVEGFSSSEKLPERVDSRYYKQAVLYEDYLSGAECIAFANALHAGEAKFGHISLPLRQNTQWMVERPGINSEFPPRARYIVSLRFSPGENRRPVKTLLTADELPYYPDGYEAARDWLPFPSYHGDSDGRNGQIFFLLPEVRAFILDAKFSDPRTLQIVVGGKKVEARKLWIKGAYWKSKQLHQFRIAVENGEASVQVPTDSDRLEYFLIDHAGTIYDFHREDRFTPGRLGLRRTDSDEQSLVDDIREACAKGEGLHIEFKPFLFPADKLVERSSGKARENAKLGEAVRTVVAFANAQGGRIYLGVNDDCAILGVDERFREWSGEQISQATLTRYVGALTNTIKGLVRGEVSITVEHAEVDRKLVFVVSVPRGKHGPVVLPEEYFYLYARTGASNRKVSVEQWRSILEMYGDDDVRA